MTIEKMLVISTANITPELAKELEYTNEDNILTTPANLWAKGGMIIYPHGEYGWMINVDSKFIGEPPKPLADALEQARREDCNWLLIDCDAVEYPLLETFEWN